MKADTDDHRRESIDDLDILEDLKTRLYDAIKNDDSKTKVGDLLKIIELKRKLSVAGKGEKKFWAMVDKLRQEELSKPQKKASVKKKTKR
ncbi:MAG TPA: hypothetical protein ENL22_05215 [candidate division Zixibacteria bacterium]|nr:hypothetical protein [candidate division Zixibacteria bacterium]